MTSQLNPAWRRRPASSDRLAKIGARFLSDMGDTGNQADFCRAIPFLLDAPGQEWIVRDLCEVLTQKGHSSTLFQLQDNTRGTRGEIQGALKQQGRGCEYCVMPVDSAATARQQGLDHLVFLVPANLDAVRRTYQRIKYLSERDTPEIGIVVVGPRDQHAAWRYFRKLAVGTLRYLDVPLLNLGFLPEQVTPEHGPGDQHRDNFLSRITERLLGSEFFQVFAADAGGSHE
jgi:hypothetical protein